MSMSKQDFIALADLIKYHNATPDKTIPKFHPFHITMLGNFCQSQNARFNRPRWEGYIAGTNGKNGGKVK